MIVICRLLMRESSQRLPGGVAPRLRRTDTTLNLCECPLHRGARQIKFGGKLGKGCVWRPKSCSGNPLVHAIGLQKIILQRRGAGARLSHPSVHRPREVRSLGIHTAIQTSSHLAADAAGFELSHGSRCAKSAQQNDELLATLPYQEPLAASLSPMTSKLITRSELGEMRRLLRRNIDLKMHRPRSEGE